MDDITPKPRKNGSDIWSYANKYKNKNNNLITWRCNVQQCQHSNNFSCNGQIREYLENKHNIVYFSYFTYYFS